MRAGQRSRPGMPADSSCGLRFLRRPCEPSMSP